MRVRVGGCRFRPPKGGDVEKYLVFKFKADSSFLMAFLLNNVPKAAEAGFQIRPQPSQAMSAMVRLRLRSSLSFPLLSQTCLGLPWGNPLGGGGGRMIAAKSTQAACA